MPVSLGLVDHTVPCPAAEIVRMTIAETSLDDTEAEACAAHSWPTTKRAAVEENLPRHEEYGEKSLPIRTALLITLDEAFAPNAFSPPRITPISAMEEVNWAAASAAKLAIRWANAVLLSTRDAADATNAISKNTNGEEDVTLAAQLAEKKYSLCAVSNDQMSDHPPWEMIVAAAVEELTLAAQLAA